MDKTKKLQQLLLKIPKGRVTTYAAIARKLRTHPRATGRLLSKNPYPNKYPCYRVILSSGKIGGYSGKGGKKKKMFLLRKDGIKIINNRVNLSKYIYKFK